MTLNKFPRRSFLCAVGLTTAAALTACGSSASSAAASSAAASSGAAAEPVELIVFAAASLTETLTAIGETYPAENPGVTFRFNFDSSGTQSTTLFSSRSTRLSLSTKSSPSVFTSAEAVLSSWFICF